MRSQARSRRSDPATSVEAARRIEGDGKAAKHRRMLLEAVRARPKRTAAEYGKQVGLDRFEASRRLPELRPFWVDCGDPRECEVLKSKCMTWWPAKEPTMVQRTLQLQQPKKEGTHE